MRIVIKPMGLICILLAISALAVLSILNYQKRSMASAMEARESAGALMRTFTGAAWRLNNESADASLTVTTDPNAPGVNNSVLHANVRKGNQDTPYLVRASKNVPADLPANRKLRLTIWGRSKTSDTATLYFELGKEPYTKDMDKQVALTPKWKQYRFDFTTQRAYAKDEAQVRLILGGSAGEFDFSGLELTDLDAAEAEE